MKKIKPWLILAAFRLEVDTLIQAHGFTQTTPGLYSGKLGQFPLDIQITGQGKVQCALMGAKAMLHLEYAGVILVGSAGGLCPQVSDWVAVESCVEGGFQSSPPPTFQSQWEHPIADGLSRARVLSYESTAKTLDERSQLASEYDAQLISWESAGFYRLLKESGCPGLEIRFISDRQESDLEDFKQFKKHIQSMSVRLPFFLQQTLEATL